MARKHSDLPTLFQRTAHGNYYFRRMTGNKRITINTGTGDLNAAKKFLRNYLSGESAMALAAPASKNVHQIATALAQSVVGQTIERMLLSETFDTWIEHTPSYFCNGKSYQLQLKLYFKRFVEWSFERNVIYLEDVNYSVAMRYNSYLHQKKFTPTTIKKQMRLIARILRDVAAVKNIPYNDIFSVLKKQIAQSANDITTHLPLEPEMIAAVMQEASNSGIIWRDLFLVGLQTGMRLKDAALFRWDMIHDGFIEFMPEKTLKHGNKARLPLSPLLREWLQTKKRTTSPYVNPDIAKYYLTGDWVSKHTKQIFERALGKSETQLDKSGYQRQRNGCIRSFHSFRVTFMSLLASKQVPMADAMMMLGWESVEMVKLYTKMLEKAKGDMDARNAKALNQMQELNIQLPPIIPKLIPTFGDLAALLPLYSNIAIGQIYGISDSAVNKWLKKFGLVRIKRIESPNLPQETVEHIRRTLFA